MSDANGWAFPKGSRNACYFPDATQVPAASLCTRKMLWSGGAVSAKYAGNDRCPACIKQLEKIQREENGQ